MIYQKMSLRNIMYETEKRNEILFRKKKKREKADF